MNTLSFYGGPAGKDFTITKIFPNKVAMDADIALGNDSSIYAGDYVLISYGDPNQPEFAENLTADGDISYNATLWKKEWNNGYSYREIVSIANSYPKFTVGNVDDSLPFGAAPQLSIDSSSLANPKIRLKMPASLEEGNNNTAKSVLPTEQPSIIPKYEGNLKNKLSFDVNIPCGTTFTPTVDNNGNISWTNDGGLTNPNTVNIRGPQGPIGNPLNIIANEIIIETEAQDTIAEVGAILTARGLNPQIGELIGVTYHKESNDVSYWYFKINDIWQRVQLSSGMGEFILNEKIDDATASTKAYSAKYVNGLEAQMDKAVANILILPKSAWVASGDKFQQVVNLPSLTCGNTGNVPPIISPSISTIAVDFSLLDSVDADVTTHTLTIITRKVPSSDLSIVVTDHV